MLFHTFEFAVFLALALPLYWALASRVRLQNALLLVASYIFYGWWDYRFLFLIVLSTVTDYCAALMIGNGALARRQRTGASLFAVAGAFLFVTVQWDAVAFTAPHLGLPFDIDWAHLLPDNINGWLAFLATAGLTAAGLLLHGWFGRMRETTRARAFLTLSVCANLGILGVFKYFNFFADNLNALSESTIGYSFDRVTLDLVLPVGISFYTFQTMSYTIDVYRKEIRPTASLLDLAAYVAFFPQLVAGPIERGKHLLPQFRVRRSTTASDWREGAWLIAWGLYKKVVIADNLAMLVNETFGPYDSLSLTAAPEDGLRCLVAIYAFAFQIYGDFSGYSSIARGTARILGFDIMVNFNIPYAATNPSSFWRRWHISLSSWLRDYLYIPLGGNRRGSVHVNLMLTMLLGGLWHGAAWTFVLWGAYQGALLVGYRALGIQSEPGRDKPWTALLQWVLMFHLVCVGWLLFRAQNVETILAFLQGMVLHPVGSPETWAGLGTLVHFTWFLVLMEAFQYFTKREDPMDGLHWFIRLNVWAVVILSLMALAPHDPAEFIYFAF